MGKNKPKIETVNQASEEQLLKELISRFDYGFADAMPKSNNSGMVMTKRDGKTMLVGIVKITAMIRMDGYMGKLILEQRERQKPSERKAK